MSPRNIFRPLSIAFRIHGVNFIDDSSSRCPTLQKLIQFLISSSVFILLAISYYCELLRWLDYEGAWKQLVSTFGFYALVTASYALLLSKRRSLRTLFLNLSLHLQDAAQSKSKIFYYLMILVIGCPYFISFCDGLYYVVYFRVDFQKIDEIVLLFMWTFIVSPINLFCISLNLFICYNFNTIFINFKADFKRRLDRRMNHPTWCQLVKDFVVQHRRLSKLIEDFNDIYSNIYLMYFVFDVTLIVFYIRELNLNKEIEDWNYKYFPSILKICLLLLTQVVAVAQVNSQVLWAIHLMQPQLLVSGNSNEQTKSYTLLANSELSLYIQQVSINPATLKAGNFFAINKGTVLSIGATVLTYILVLYGNNS